VTTLKSPNLQDVTQFSLVDVTDISEEHTAFFTIDEKALKESSVTKAFVLSLVSVTKDGVRIGNWIY
jgi:hypothetical protein